MKIEALSPLHIKRSAGDIHLQPGSQIELSDADAAKLLSKAPDKVRIVEPTRLESAAKPDGRPLSAIYWESGDGRILGPAVPEFFAKDGDTFWIVTTFEGHTRWVNADCLRSRKHWAEQKLVVEVDRQLLKA